MSGDDDRSKRVLKAIIVAGIFLTALIIALALLLALAFERTAHSIEQTNQRLNEMQRSVSVAPKAFEIDYGLITKHINEEISKEIAALPKPKDGKNGTDGVGLNGINGLTPPCYFQVGQCQGPRGLDGLITRQLEFDGDGHWRFIGDDEWLPLFKISTGVLPPS